MIDVLYANREKIEIKELKDAKGIDSKKFVWIRAVSPQEDEIITIEKLMNFDDDDAEDFRDFLKEGARPRLTKEDYVEIIYSVPFYEDGDLITEPIIIYVYKNFVLTVERNKIPICEKIVLFAKRNKGKYLFKKNTSFFASEIIDRINDEFLSNVNKIASRTDIITSKNIQLNEQQIDSIFSASTTLSFFNQAILANIEVLNGLKKLHHKSFKADDRETFNDIYFDALQILDTEKVQREVIMNVFNMQSIISSNKINEFMKKLTSLALIIMIPTLITGIYGMNLNWLPFAGHENGFGYIVAIMALITITTYLVFKKIDWV
jgi:magnesium transporter